jgi:RecJ OB domain
VRDRGRDAGSAIAFGLGTQLDRFRQVGRYDVVFRLEANQWNGTVAPQLVVRRVLDAPERYESLREQLAEEWRREAGERSPEAAVIFAELALDAETTVKQPLLESEAFRALLKQPDLAQAA